MRTLMPAMCALVLSLEAIGGASQQRDSASAAAELGTAVVAGVVLSTTGTATPQPARRAIVTLTGAALPLGRSAVTDDEGRFVLDRLPAGRFMLSATKPAYLTASYGAKRPGRAGVPLVLAAGSRLGDLSLMLTHGAAIAGTIRDKAGAPVFGATVSAFRVLPDDTLIVAGTAMSDDRGAYRVFGLTAGVYVVSASLPVSAGQGQIGELTSETIDRKLEALRARRAPQAPRPPAPASSPIATSSVVPVFHPHAFSAADAARVSVGFGEDRSSTDVVLDRVPAAVVEGRVAGVPAGTPLTITMSPAASSLQANAGGPSLTVRPVGSDTFQFTHVAPGRYIVTARTPVTVRPMLWARSEIEIAGSDVRGLALTLQPGLQFTGRIVFEATRLAPPADLSSVQVMLDDASPRPVGPAGSGRGGQPASGSTTDARGNFALHDVIPATYRVRTSLMADPEGWWLRSAMVNGRDVLDAPLRVDTATPLSGAVLTFSDRHTRLSGALEVPAHASASTYYIVVFPEDRTMWLPRARRIQSARPGTDGTYVFRDLPPGTYRLAALTDVGPDDLMDVTFLDAILPASIRVVLNDGEQKTQSLRVGGS